MLDDELWLLKHEELRILTEFQRLCVKHNLKYYITAGTLLGAVRHKGFIPWDDDIDVAMLREDFDRFAILCEKDLSPDFFYQSNVTDSNYPFFFSKLRKNGTSVNEPSLEKINMHKGVYIDIFPLDVCPQSDWGGKLYFKWVEQLQCAILARETPDFICGYRKPYMRMLHALLCLFSHRTLSVLWEHSRRLVTACCSGERLCTVCAAHGYPRETYEKDWFDETVTLEFEGTLHPAPGGWEALLTNMYGDYMTPPPEQERQGHFE